MCVNYGENYSSYSKSHQDSHNPSFVPKVVEAENIVGDELVPSLSIPPSSSAPVNNDHIVESPHSPYIELGERGWKVCIHKSLMFVLVNIWRIIRIMQREK